MTNTEQDIDDTTADAPAPAVNPILAGIFKALGMGPKSPPAGAAAAKTVAPVNTPPVPAKQTAPVAGKPASASSSSARGPVQMPQGPLTTVVVRNEFYRDGFRNLIKIAILEALIIVGLILTLIVFMTNEKPLDRYFATTADGRIMQLVPLDQENMSPAALMSWVAQSATEVMTFGYHDYQRRLQQSSRHFTKPGWESFTGALQKAGVIDSVQAQQQVVTAAPISAPILVQKGVLNGRFRWLLQMPLMITYKGTGTQRVDKVNLNLVVERVPSLENPAGVGIAQWVAVAR
jgi:intracellular multiplication protein IcmL